jgi:hypothetical protein
LLLHVSALRLVHLGSFLWEVPVIYVPLVGVELSCAFLSLHGGGSSIVNPSASCSQDVGFYPLFHTGYVGLAAKALTVVKLQSNKCQLLLLSQYI